MDLSWNPFEWRGAEFLVLYGTLVAALIVYRLVRGRAEKKRAFPPLEGVLPDDLSPYHVALLSGGRPGVIQAVLSAFYARGWLTRSEEKGMFGVAAEASELTDPFERRAVAAAGSEHFQVKDFSERLIPALDMLEADLEARGLFLPLKGRKRLLSDVLRAAGVLLGFGVVKVAVGMMRERPTFFLILLCLVVFGVIISACLPFTRRTPWGQQVLGALKMAHAPPPPGSLPLQRQPDFGAAVLAVPLLVGLHGLSVMSAWGHEGFARYLPAVMRTPDAGGGGGTGCGGGGCGSGCGGGGGCGGCGGGD